MWFLAITRNWGHFHFFSCVATHDMQPCCSPEISMIELYMINDRAVDELRQHSLEQSAPVDVFRTQQLSFALATAKLPFSKTFWQTL
jgi:hypothetical protein